MPPWPTAGATPYPAFSLDGALPGRPALPTSSPCATAAPPSSQRTGPPRPIPNRRRICNPPPCAGLHPHRPPHIGDLTTTPTPASSPLLWTDPRHGPAETMDLGFFRVSHITAPPLASCATTVDGDPPLELTIPSPTPKDEVASFPCSRPGRRPSPSSTQIGFPTPDPPLQPCRLLLGQLLLPQPDDLPSSYCASTRTTPSLVILCEVVAMSLHRPDPATPAPLTSRRVDVQCSGPQAHLVKL